MAFKDTSIFWKLNVCLQFTGLILSLAGFGSNYILTWTGGRNTLNAGLWKYCYNGDCYDITDTLDYHDKSTVWVDASKVMMIMCLLGQFASGVLSAIAICGTVTPTMVLANAGVAFFSVLPGIIGAGVAVGEGKSDFHDITGVTIDIGWSFILFMISQAIFVLVGLLHLIDSRFGSAGTGQPPPSKPMHVM